MKRVFPVVSVAVLFIALASQGLAGEQSAYGEIAGHYEAIRQALLHDTIEGITEHAGAIRRASSGLHQRFSAESASVPEARSDGCRALLPTIRDAASRLAAARSINDARESFGELSRSMVGYRRIVTKPDSVVVYCSMAEKVWLQPAGEIGNPYYGQGMARCGEVVSE